MNKTKTIYYLVGLTALAGLVVWLWQKPGLSEINSFEDCVKAGYPVMESFPEQCKTPDGRTFINEKQNMESELKIEDLKIGEGAEAQNGKTVTVNYTGKLENGKKFDSSYDRNQPFSFILGTGQVIQGWEKGILGMKVGGERKLTIPPSLGYGQAGIPNVIPQNATLIFEVELLEVK